MQVRIRYTKHGKIRFTSHRDIARVWERTFRKAGVEVAYSEGFAPRPKLHFGLALPTGYESDAEYLDADLGTALSAADLAALPGSLTEALPEGLAATAAGVVVPGTPSLQHAVTCCRWRIEVLERDRAGIEALVAGASTAETLPVTRVRKGIETTDDVRPYVESLDVGPDTVRGAELVAELGTQPRALRPSELLRALDPSAELGLVIRTHQWTLQVGVRREPLVPGPLRAGRDRDDELVAAASAAPHAEVRA